MHFVVYPAAIYARMGRVGLTWILSLLSSLVWIGASAEEVFLGNLHSHTAKSGSGTPAHGLLPESIALEQMSVLAPSSLRTLVGLLALPAALVGRLFGSMAKTARPTLSIVADAGLRRRSKRSSITVRVADNE